MAKLPLTSMRSGFHPTFLVLWNHEISNLISATGPGLTIAQPRPQTSAILGGKFHIWEIGNIFVEVDNL